MIVYKRIGDKKIAYLSPSTGSRGTSDEHGKMDSELKGILDRADELVEDFRNELERCIENMSITERAKNLFHEVLIKLRSALDIAMSKAWAKHISPILQTNKVPKIHFPICDKLQNFSDSMKRMKMQNLETQNRELYNLILRGQPFSTGKKHLSDFRDLANLGKHTRLVLQELESKEPIRVTAPQGTMIYSKATQFPSGRIAGTPVDPDSQRIIPTSDVKDEEIIWVQCSVEGYGHDSLVFCLELCQGTRRFLQEMAEFL